jgi:hypothetical protein
MLRLTFGRTVDDLVLLLRVLEDALRAEHVPVLHAVELDLFRRVRHAVLDLRFRHLASGHCGVGGRGHGEAGEDLVVDGQVVWSNLMITLVVGALNDSVLGEFADALGAE